MLKIPQIIKMVQDKTRLIEALALTAQNFCRKGWNPATSGNLSVLLSRIPFKLAITPTGINKSSLQSDQIVIVDENGTRIEGKGNPSSDIKLHLAVLKSKPEINSVFHIHSIWNTLLSSENHPGDKVVLQQYELLKALRKNYSPSEKIYIPILQSQGDQDQLSKEFSRILKEDLDIHGILLKQHGLYSWGENLQSACQRVEALEFLFEVQARQLQIRKPQI
jgi:methylthioribulose-1-phosphate dehydratase